MNRDILERPFEKSLIKQRKGRAGLSFSYVEGAEYIRRLNEAFEGDWSFCVVDYKILDTDVVVTGRLSHHGIVKEQFGGTAISKTREGEVISLADDLKTAATDALKKCASLLGVGLELYSKDGQGARPSSGGGGPKVSEKQLKAIAAITRAIGWSPELLVDHCKETFGCEPRALSVGDASTLISELKAMEAQR